MIAKISPLELGNFYVLESNYSFIPPSHQDSLTVQEAFDQYKIDIDYRVTNPDEDEEFNVFLKANVNSGKQKLPGYSVFIECVGVFKIDRDSISEEIISNLMRYSCVTMLIGCMRGKIMNLTSDGPVGKYILPSIDMQDLEMKKVASFKNKRTKRNTKEIKQ